ncbi:hypothetical protein BDY24DRAFT_403192 [Mrakia frigida]|uniref:alpha-ketoglutarate-dependent dioxygenase AlkB n=1 Tax=Mrakia frigida TaxID=29902 RepID=UPI003FCC1552
MRISFPKMSLPSTPTSSAFRDVERMYKCRIHPDDLKKRSSKARKGWKPSLEDVFDPRTARALSLPAELHQVGGGWSEARRDMEVFSVGKGSHARVALAFKEVPGLVILPSYFSPSSQRTLIRSCLATHTVSPNQTNLDSHFLLPQEGLWSASINNPSVSVPTKASLLDSTTKRDPSKFVEEGTGRVLVDNACGEVLGSIEDMKARVLLEVAPSQKLKNTEAEKLMRDLRWTNIGLFYDWTSKSYDFNRVIPFPTDLSVIAKAIVHEEIDWKKVYDRVGEAQVGWESWGDYEPDAGIINFYSPDDTLMAHVDRSELDPHRPLVSISLGLSAVFLLGGPTRETTPLPILLRSGDVVVMSGPGRRSYHGVPRVLDGTLPDHLKAGAEEGDWEGFARYLETTRININARQVFPGGWDQSKDGDGATLDS